jgi:hypothetical protein
MTNKNRGSATKAGVEVATRCAPLIGIIAILVAGAASAAPQQATPNDCTSAQRCLIHPVIRHLPIVWHCPYGAPSCGTKPQPVQIPEDIKPLVGPTLD